MGNTVESLLMKRYGPRALFGRVPSLFTKNLKSLERLAYQGHVAARMGLITTCYLQQASGNLLDNLRSDTPNLDSAIQNVRDIFALSTKSLDQTARTGAFHHMIRRRATMYDTGLNELRDYANTIVTLPLTVDAEVLPDTKRVTFGPQLGKRKPTATITSESTFVKKPKFDSNFKIPKKNFGEFKSSGKQTPANKPWIPVEGRLKHFIQEWESITDDQWVLKTLQEGLKLEFQETPHLTCIKHTSVNARNFHIILAEVEDLIEKNAIEIVPQAEIHQVHKTYRKFLRFCIQGKCYQFVALCFGSSQAPRVFTKIIIVVAAHLRTQNIRLATYLDDWLLVNAQEKMLISDREKTLSLLVKLGFIVNLQKSSLIPSQEITYIGALFNFKKEIVSPTMERILKLEMLVRSLMKGHNTARDYLMLLGLIASSIELIPNARLFMRPIQLHLLHFWRPSTRDLTYQIPFTQHLKDHLNWWLDRANTTKGKSLHQWSATVTITTDASKTGFGGHMNNQIFQGFWSVQEQKQHINLLELEAVIRTVQHFLPQLQNQNVLLKCDNTTVVQYVNKQVGTKSIHLCYKTWCLMKMAIQNNLTFRAAHIAGKLNILADHLSRNKIQPTE
ncbi:unnamed protein product [Mytilus coruscus]|nr:unnamed protein product [Mytilus coruscus]